MAKYLLWTFSYLGQRPLFVKYLITYIDMIQLQSTYQTMKSIVLLLLCTQILGNPILRDPASDEYIDKVLESLRDLIAQEGLDPAQLPDGDASFSETILGREPEILDSDILCMIDSV